MSDQKITIQNVWNDKTDQQVQEIIDFWNENKAIPPTVDISKRALQVVLIVRNENNKIVGVTTSYLKHYSPLKSDFFVFRGMIAPDFRIPGLFIKLAAETTMVLEKHSKSLTGKNRPIGIIAEMENPQLKKVRSTKTPSGMVLIGFSKRDNPIYVHYFKGARFGQ